MTEALTHIWHLFGQVFSSMSSGGKAVATAATLLANGIFIGMEVQRVGWKPAFRTLFKQQRTLAGLLAFGILVLLTFCFVIYQDHQWLVQRIGEEKKTALSARTACQQSAREQIADVTGKWEGEIARSNQLEVVNGKMDEKLGNCLATLSELAPNKVPPKN